MPCDYSKYPSEWREFSRAIRFNRADGTCECNGECGAHPEPCMRVNGTTNERGAKVVLTVAHLCDCSPLCADASHVKAYCQRCHLVTDAAQHAANAKRTRARKNDERRTLLAEDGR